MMGEPVKTAPDKCTNCHKETNAVTCVGEEGVVAPRPGDITMCIYCGHLMGFNKDGKMQNLNSKEMLDIAGDRRILAVSDALGKLWEKHDNKIQDDNSEEAAE